MSNENDKLKHSTRKQQKINHIKRQMEIRKAHADVISPTAPGGRPEETPHRYHKVSGMTCGDPNCVMCGNPRKFFGERTVQEQRDLQDLDTPRHKHSNGILPEDD
jgi:hypothetical protein